MKKSFKKAVAVLLSVLMVAFSVPITALAAPGDYAPNVEMVFGTFHADDATDWQDYTVAAGKTFDLCSLYDVPLEYNRDAGTLTLSAAKAAVAAPVLGYTAPEADVTYGVGDYFTATVLVENIETLQAMQVWLEYSDNIEPAGYYNYRSGRQTVYALGTVSEAEAAGGTMTVGGINPLTAMSSQSFYEVNKLGENPNNFSTIDTESRWLKCAEVKGSAAGDGADVSSAHDDYFADPDTGNLETGYTYDAMICETFVFKIVGEGAITFEMADPYDEFGAFEAGFYTAKLSDGIMLYDYTTYAPNFDDGATTGTTENPGSRKMTFFGENIHNITETEQYTVKFENYAGQVVSETKYDEGTAAASVTVPENTAASSDDDNHYTYAWPEITDVTADVTYKETRTETAHDWVKDEEASTEPTCTAAGHYVYECTVGGETYDEYPEALGHSFTDYVYNNDATCQADGTETAKCDRCDATDTRTAAGTKVDHSYGEYVYNNDATCTEDGTETASCIYGCGTQDTRTAAGTATGHDWGEWTVTKEPTYEEAGEETRVCKNDPSHTETRTVPALQGISVTVEAVDLGTATINDEAVTAENVTINVAANADVTLTATPVEGAEFVGWEVNGKIVSTEANYTAKALANIVYTPVFQLVEDTDGTEFTVVFTDKFGNVISTQTVASGADIVIPAVPDVAGYTAAGWSLSDEEIQALTEATTITAKYERIVENTYTVTATGATISTQYVEAEDTVSEIGYNTLVTVTAPGATAWKMGDTTVAYGETYSFYIGTDMNLTPVFDAVTATPTVAAVSVTEIGSENALKASFLATREMTDDCTYVNAGFVYAANPASNEITLADVNGTDVMAAYCATESNQFALSVGLQAQTGTIVARAFLAYVDADGATQVVYADPQTYTYA